MNHDGLRRGRTVYWTEVDQQGLGDGFIAKASLRDGTTTTLASGLTVPRGITVDSSNVYWVDFTAMTVNSVPIGGGAVTTLATNQNGPFDIAVDCRNLYWTNLLTGDAGVVELSPK